MNELYEYLKYRGRGKGSTTLMLSDAKTYPKPFYVVAGTMKSAQHIARLTNNKNAKPITPDKEIRGVDYPVLIDTHGYITVVEEHQVQMDILQKKVDHLHEQYNELQKKFLDKCNELGRANGTIINEKRKYREDMEKLRELSFFDRLVNFRKIMEMITI